MTLQTRFTIYFAGFVVVASAVLGWTAWRTASAALEEELDKKLISVAGAWSLEGIAPSDEEILRSFRRGDEDSNTWRDYRARLLRLQGESVDRADIFYWNLADSVVMLVSTEDPDSFYVTQPLRWARPYAGTDLLRAYDEGSATTGLIAGADGRYHKYGFVRVNSSQVFLGVQIPADYLTPLRRLRNQIVLFSLAGAVVGGVLAWMVARGIAGRLATLSVAALRIQRGMMDMSIPASGGDELTRLARAMERMREGIRRRDEQLRLMPSQVAHEIRNPLGGLELFAAAAQESDDPAERKELLRRMRKEVAGINRIIDDFLGFARPAEAEPQMHDVRTPLRDAAALAEAEARSKGGRLDLELPAEPLLAVADQAQVKRVALNLLRNALQAGDAISVEAGRAKGEVWFAVRDDGPGIPEGIKERIFEPFVTDKAQGAGLGLAIVKDLAESNGGRVQAANRADDGEGAGAEFRVYLRGSEDFPGRAE